MFSILFFGFFRFSRLFPQVRVRQVSLASDVVFSSSCQELSEHSCLTAVLSHAGHSPLPFPVIVVSLLRWCSPLPLLFLSWRESRERPRYWCKQTESKGKGREAEREHICQNGSKTLGEAEKAVGSCSRSRWSECVRASEGGREGD